MVAQRITGGSHQSASAASASVNKDESTDENRLTRSQASAPRENRGGGSSGSDAARTKAISLIIAP